MKIAEKVMARAASVDAATPVEQGGSHGAVEVPAEPQVEESSDEQQVEVRNAPPPMAADPEAEEAAVVQKTQRSILEEKLAETRAKRKATEAQLRASREERQTRGEAQRQLEAARAERAKWERIGKDKSFKEALLELGRDPLETFKEMQREAAEAGTPEAMLRSLESKMNGIVEQANAKIAALEAQLEQSNQRDASARFTSDFNRHLAAPDYLLLREAYDDSTLLQYADGFRRNPESFYAQAKKYDVLTDPRKGFTMRDILNVLKAAQEEYDSGRKTRRERLQAGNPGQQRPPTVNGTKNAESPVPTELASTRASGGRPKLSRAERVESVIRRLGG